MTDLRWIAAVLNPRDVAPHPNFMSSEQLSPSSLLALVVQGRLVDYARLTREDGDGEVRYIGADGAEDRLHRAAVAALSVGTVAEGATALASLVADHEELDPGAAASAALIGAVSFAEIDDRGDLFALLDLAIDRVSQGATPEDQFVHAALLVQRAMRLLEDGDVAAGRLASMAETLLDGIRLSSLASFPTSRSVSRSSASTLKMIVGSLRSSIRSTRYVADQGWTGNGWQRLVRAVPATLNLLTTRTAVSSLEALASELAASTTLSNSQTWHADDPVDSQVWQVEIQFELLGDLGLAKAWRTTLGQLRLWRAPRGVDDWRTTDAVRLLRHAENVQGLESALRYLKLAGPLHAITDNARVVLERRADPTRLRAVELVLLREAGDLLPEDEASAACDLLIEALRSPGPVKLDGVEAPVLRLERIWQALPVMAAVTGRGDEIAAVLLELVRGTRAPDFVVDRTLAQAAAALDWSALSPTTVAAWGDWLRSVGATQLPAVAGQLPHHLDLSPAELTDIELTNPVDRVVALLNAAIAHPDVQLDANSVGDASTFVVRQMEEEQARARDGHFTFGGVALADLAVGLAVYGRSATLWSPLIRFLGDQRVARMGKSAGLERLAREVARIPGEYRPALVDAVLGILEQQHDFPLQPSEIVPYPAALRLAIALGALGRDQVLVEVCRLAGNQKAEARLDAARTLALQARQNEPPSYVVALALQLSHDTAPTVRAEAGRVLALLLDQGQTLHGILGERLLALLSEPGALIPVLVLRGFSEAEMSLPSEILEAVGQLASQHPSYGVRLQARHVLTRPIPEAAS